MQTLATGQAVLDCRGAVDPAASMKVVVERGVRLRIFAKDPDHARAFYAQVLG
jgi:hypothetical protein